MNRRRFLSISAASLALAGSVTQGAAAQAGDAGRVMNGNDPMAAAEYLSSLEATAHIPALYELYSHIHPDAAEVVPRGTVIGWYQEDFQSRGPKVARAYDVAWLDSWTWEVTGATYSDVAEVSFTQEFANGETLDDVVRLVFHDGSWRWWFGRDAAWVEDQKLRFSLIENTPQTGGAPAGLAALTSLDEAILDHLPDVIDDPHVGRTYELAPTAGSFTPDGIQQPEEMLIYTPVNGTEFQLGNVTYGSVIDSRSDAEDLLRFADYAQNAPPVTFTGWNTAPESGPAWLQTENAGVDVIGTSYSITLVMNGKYMIIRLFSEAAMEMVLDTLGNAAQG